MSDIRRPISARLPYFTEPSAFINMLSEHEKDTICAFYEAGNSLEATVQMILEEMGISVVTNPLRKLLHSRGIKTSRVYKLRTRCPASMVEHHIVDFWKSSGGCTLKDIREYLMGLIGRAPTEATISRVLQSRGLRIPAVRTAKKQK